MRQHPILHAHRIEAGLSSVEMSLIFILFSPAPCGDSPSQKEWSVVHAGAGSWLSAVGSCSRDSTKTKAHLCTTLQNIKMRRQKVVALFGLKVHFKSAILLSSKAKALGEKSSSAFFCTLRGKAAPGAGCKRKRGMCRDQAGTCGKILRGSARSEGRQPRGR